MSILNNTHSLLSVAEMYRSDALAIDSGISGIELMEAAGRSVARIIQSRWERRPVSVLCGPGNNGGDGFAAARYLQQTGWHVFAYVATDTEKMKGDAGHHAALWQSRSDQPTETLSDFKPEKDHIVIDALFGAGLNRDLNDTYKSLFERITATGCPVLAVDLPSGISADSGDILGSALQAHITVTFFRRKYGHLLFPGAGYCGETIVTDIGISADVLDELNVSVRENTPGDWIEAFPQPAVSGHKYNRRHAVILGGSQMTGAARLAARAARRMGAGLSSILATSESFPTYAAGDPGTIVEKSDSTEADSGFLSDTRRSAVLVGPGAGINHRTRCFTLQALKLRKSVVIDADGLTAFEDNPEQLFEAIQSPCVITPHAGEFARLFGFPGDKISIAKEAARLSGAIVLLKGPDTVIAAPCGKCAINTNAVPDLATAGAGDVLAGIIVALLAQGMDPFTATAAGAWIHGAASVRIGAGLIAEDLCEQLPHILKELRNSQATP